MYHTQNPPFGDIVSSVTQSRELGVHKPKNRLHPSIYVVFSSVSHAILVIFFIVIFNENLHLIIDGSII